MEKLKTFILFIYKNLPIRLNDKNKNVVVEQIQNKTIV